MIVLHRLSTLPDCIRISGIAGLLLFSQLQAAVPYADKPSWWDSAKRSVTLQVEGDLRSSYETTRDEALKRFRIDRSPWWILGPFDAPDGLKTPHPPERNPRLVPNARFRDRDGNLMEWRPLSENPNALKGNNFIVYFSTVFELQQGRPVWLVPEHDDGMALWVNGNPTYLFPKRRQEGFASSTRVNLPAGRHQVFAKLHQQDRRWAAELDLYQVDPRFVDIMALTQALTHPPFEEDPQWARLAGNLAEKWTDIEHFENAMHWQAERFHLLGKGERQDLYKWLSELRNEKPGAGPHLLEFYRMAYASGIDSDPVRLELMLAHLELLEAAKDPLSLRLQFNSYRQDLEELAPVEADLLRIRLTMQEGDLTQARRLYREVTEERPELEDDGRFRNLKRDLEELRETAVQLPMDWDFDGTVRQAGRLAKADPEELHRYIRSILRDKSGSLVATRDSNLFQGARAGYLEAFAPYAEGYQESLQEYLNLLTRQLDLKDEELRRQTLRYSLTPNGQPDLQVQRTSAGAFRLPPSQGVDRLITLDSGSREISMETPYFRDIYPKPVTIGLGDDRKGYALQNSRSVAMFEGSQLMWRFVAPPTVLSLAEDTRPVHGHLRPALSGDRVFARMLRGGRYVLTAFNRANGNVEWTWPSDDRVLCTNPVIWGHQVLTVTRSPDQIAQYTLAFLNQQTGILEEELPLLVGAYRQNLEGYGDTEFDHYMPDPVLAGDTLFLQSNNGVMTAVDLETFSTRWSRKYANADWNERSRNDKVQDRWNAPPAVVNNIAVFGPMDAKSLKAVDAVSGDLLAQEGTIDWISLHPFGNHLLVIDRERKGWVLEPQSLKTLEQLPNEGYRVIRVLDGGIVLERKGVLEVWTANPLRRMSRQALPSGWRTLAVTPQGVLMDRPDQLETAVGLGTSSSGVKGRPVPMAGTANPERVARGLFRSGRNALYVLSEGAVQKWSGPDKPDWVIPAVFHGDLRKVRLFESGNHLYLTDRFRICTFRASTGEVLDRWPRVGDEWVQILGMNMEGDTLMFAIPRGNRSRDGHDIVLMKNGRTRVLGRLRRSKGTPLMVADQGNRVVTVDHDTMYELKRDAGEGKWETVRKEKIGRERWRSYLTMEGGTQIDAHSGHADIISSDGTFQRVKTHNWKTRYQNPKKVYDDPALENDILFWKRSRDFWNAVHLTSGKDLTRGLKTTTRPVVAGDKAFGLEFNSHWRANKLTPRVVNLSSGRESSAEVIELSKEQRSWREVSGERFSFTDNTFVYHLLRPWGDSDSVDENPVVIINPDTRSVRISGFPDTGPIRDIRVWKNQLWLLRRHDLIRLPLHKFNTLLYSGQTIVDPMSLPSSLRIDGVHAEWGPDDMADLGGGVFAHHGPEGLVLAGTIRNREFIHALGRHGVDERVTLHLRNGSAASFVMDKGVDMPVVNLPEGAAFAYSVHPAGDRMFYELSIPAEQLKNLEFNPLATREKPERERRGDFAFDLSIRNPDDVLVFGHAERPWPVWFPRFHFTAD